MKFMYLALLFLLVAPHAFAINSTQDAILTGVVSDPDGETSLTVEVAVNINGTTIPLLAAMEVVDDPSTISIQINGSDFWSSGDFVQIWARVDDMDPSGEQSEWILLFGFVIQNSAPSFVLPTWTLYAGDLFETGTRIIREE